MNEFVPGLFVVGTDTGVGKTRIAAGIARAMAREGRCVGVLKPVATGAIREGDGWKVDDADALIAALGRFPLGSDVLLGGAGVPARTSEAHPGGQGRPPHPEKSRHDQGETALGGDVTTAEVCPIAFAEPLAPPVAARQTGRLLGAADVFDVTLAAIRHWQSERGAEVMVVEGVGGLLCPLAEGITVADLAVRLDYPLVVAARRGLGTLNHTLLTIEAAASRSLRVAGVILNGAEPTADPLAEATNPAELARRLGPVPILADLPHEPGGESAPVVLGGLDWYNRASRPRLPFPPM